jgi:hypothetical protein
MRLRRYWRLMPVSTFMQHRAAAVAAVEGEPGTLGTAWNGGAPSRLHQLAISDDSEREIWSFVRASRCGVAALPFALGDVSFHSGWTLHRAGPNRTAAPREAHTVQYVSEAMR